VTDRLSQLILGRLRDVPDFPKPGILFKDITPILADPECFSAVVQAMAAPQAAGASGASVDVVVGIEARGFILGAPVALALGAAFVPMRKSGKLPWRTVAATYDLEYGTAEVELHEDAVITGQRVLIVDDVLATGGTAEAAVSLVEGMGGQVVALAVLVELGFLDGRSRLSVPVHALATA
jgi:adenine phosphoribosyltransferase